MLNVFFTEECPNWYYGYPSKDIPNLEVGQPSVEWTASDFLTDRALQTEMLITKNYIEDKINSINAEPIADDNQIDKIARENDKKIRINVRKFSLGSYLCISKLLIFFHLISQKYALIFSPLCQVPLPTWKN